MNGIIYKYTTPSGKSYIGKTIHEHTRYMRHKRMEGDTPFHRAINKYGFENVSYEVIAYADTTEMLNFMERHFIRKFNTYGENGYNLTQGGDGGSGLKHTEEFKIKASIRMKNDNPAWNMTEEWRENIRKVQIGKHMSDEFREKTSIRMKNNNPMKNPDVVMRNANNRKGRHLTEEHKKLISEFNKGKIVSDETKQKMSVAAKKRLRDSKGHYIKNKEAI